VVNAASAQIVAKVSVGLTPTSVAVSADGSTAYVANGYGYSLSEITTATNTVKFTLPHVGVYPFSVVLYQ
jgi:YVTN family beta-propeller protein